MAAVPNFAPQELYAKVYCARGEMESPRFDLADEQPYVNIPL